MGENPAVGSANAKMQRLGLANLDWLVVRDFTLIESATWWKDGPEIETGEMRTEDIGTEVFFFPAAAHTEKAGTFTNTNRMLQWHHQAQEPAGDSPQRPVVHVPPRPAGAGAAGRLDRRAGPAGARPDLGLPGRGPARRARRPRPCSPRSTATTPTATRSRRYTQLKDDGSTSCGCWIYCGVVRRRGQPGRPPQAGQRAGLGRAPSGPGPGRPTGAPSTTAPPPTPRATRGASARPTSGGTRSRARGPGTTSPTSPPTKPPSYRPPEDASGAGRASRHRRVHHAGRRQGLALRPGRAGRRPAARRTTSRRTRRSATRSTASSATRPGRSVSRTRTTASTPAGDAGHRRVPVRRSPPTG